MQESIAVMLFDSYDGALAARARVIDQDAADVRDVQLVLRDDEAGPACRNFVADDGCVVTRNESGKPPDTIGCVVVIAACRDDDALARVRTHMTELGGREAVQALRLS